MARALAGPPVPAAEDRPECLGVLMASGPITAGRLAEEIGLTTGAITGIIDRLEGHGHVERQRDTHDRRRVYIHVNHANVGRITPLFASIEASMEQLFVRYSDVKLRAILDFMQAATEITRQETFNLRGG
jgi:DNA-binding MarR family transcriptional regulator